MAEIPIERKSGRNWLPILLAALVILALLAWWATRNKSADNTTASLGDTATTASVGAAGGATTGAAAGGSGSSAAEFASYITTRDTTQETEGNHQYTAGGIRRLADALDAMASGNGSGAGMSGGSSGTGTAGSGATGSGTGGSGSAASGTTGSSGSGSGTAGTSGTSTAGGTGSSGAGGSAAGGSGTATGTGTSAAGGSTAGMSGGMASVRMYTDSMRRSVDRLQQSASTDLHADDVKAAFSAAVSAMDQINRSQNRTHDVAAMRAIYNQLDSKRPLLQQLATVQRFFESSRDALQTMGSAG